ncbi:MAG: hypothetical protein NVS4B9_21470 [Ktedonobacteraceae bacterium]
MKRVSQTSAKVATQGLCGVLPVYHIFGKIVGGVYWKSPFNLMEGHFEKVMIVTAEHLKRVPGRKTDKKDAEWIAELLQFGLLKPSFIPSPHQRELRDLTRLRTPLIAERTRLVKRFHKTLEDTNLKLASVLTDIMGKSGQQILSALLRGEQDPVVLADLALGRAMSKRDALVQALQGRLSEHHRLLLQELLSLIERHEQAISRLDKEIEERLRSEEALIQRLDAIAGCSRRSIEVLLAEIGSDVSAFPDAAHLACLQWGFALATTRVEANARVDAFAKAIAGSKQCWFRQPMLRLEPRAATSGHSIIKLLLAVATNVLLWRWHTALW